MMVNLDQMPPDWNFAQNHAKALKPGAIQNLQFTKEPVLHCKCCLRRIQKEEISLNSNSKQLKCLGFGFPLYFIFIKYCIILILLLICSYSGVSLYWAINQNYDFCSHRRLESDIQQNSHCTSFLIIFSRIQHSNSGQQIILRIMSFLVHLFALIYIRDSLKKIIEYYDQKTPSLSDFSLLMKKLPRAEGIQEGIRKFILNNCNLTSKWKQYTNREEKAPLNQAINNDIIIKITLLPDITNYFKLNKEKHEIIQKKRQILIQNYEHKYSKMRISPQQTGIFEDKLFKNTKELIEQQLKSKENQIKKQIKNYIQLAGQDKLYAQMAIVTLNAQIYKHTVLNYVSSNGLKSSDFGQKFAEFSQNIKVQEAPEPNQIIWENIVYSSKDRLIGKIISWSLTIIFLAIVTVVFYFLLVAKTNNLIEALQDSHSASQAHENHKYQIAVFLVYFGLFSILFFNKLIMGWALHHFTDLQKHENSSDYQFSFALKYTFGLFFTTAIMTLAVEAITFHNFFSHPYGVVEEESIMFFINAILIPLIWLINPWKIYNSISRTIKKDKPYYTQAQANKIMCGDYYTLGKRYAQIIQTMWFTYLYATIIPLGAMLTFLGLCLYYWIDKFNLLRHSSLKHNVSGKIVMNCLKLLDITLILRPIGQIIFDNSIRDHVSAESIVFICVGFVYLILPMNSLLELFHEQIFEHEKKKYSGDAENQFIETYQSLHPIFSQLKIKKILTNYKHRKKIVLTEIQDCQSLRVQNIDKSRLSQHLQNFTPDLKQITDVQIES